MFVVLTFSEINRRSFLIKFLDKLKRRRLEVTEKTALNCKYIQIDQPMAGAGASWKSIETIAGRWANRLVMNKGVNVPPSCMITRADTTEYETRLMVNTACHVLKLSKTELYERQVGLVDPSGKWQWAAVELLKYCTTLIVYTQAPQRYERFCAQMMELYGAPVIIADNMTALDSCIFIVSPQKEKQQWPLCPVLTFADASTALIINNLSPLPQQLGCEIPPGLDPLEFAAALWRFGRVNSMLGLHAEACRIGGRLSNIRDCAALILNKAVSLRSDSHT